MSLVKGNGYDREQIRNLLGGGDLVSYLPSSKGVILAGCFDPELNQRAPLEIDVGSGPKVVRGAKLLAAARGMIPVFLKRKTNHWEYRGIYRCVSFSQSKEDIEAYPDRRKDAVGVLYFEEMSDRSTENILDPELLDMGASEGKKRLITHIRRERSRDLIIAKRREIRAIRGCLICEACGKSERDLPICIGEACFEVHHKIPFSLLVEQAYTRLADVSLLCANCHRMIHRSEPMKTVDELRTELNSLSASLGPVRENR